MSAAYFDQRAFSDSVMARVARELPPTPARALGMAVRNFDGPSAFGAIWTAWHLLTVRNSVVRPRLRIRSAALLSVVLLLVVIGSTVAAAGAAVVVHTAAERLSAPAPAVQFPSETGRPEPSNDAHGLPPVVPQTEDPKHRPTTAPNDAVGKPADGPSGRVDNSPPPKDGTEPGDTPKPRDGGNGNPKPGDGDDNNPGDSDGDDPERGDGDGGDPDDPGDDEEGTPEPGDDDDEDATPEPDADDDEDASPEPDDDSDPGDIEADHSGHGSDGADEADEDDEPEDRDAPDGD
jgi:hypothetical protein